MTELKKFYDIYARFTGEEAEQVKKDYDTLGKTHREIYLEGLKAIKGGVK
jgi:hypothetical protein